MNRSEPRFGLTANLAALLLIAFACARPQPRTPPVPTAGPASYVGRESCLECHRDEFDRWRGSDHALAMQAANDSTVLGNFDDATFNAFGVTSRFYRKDGKYWVHTQGPGGALGDYEIIYTFGVRPLQQYLVAFPGGRLQCLTVAWDVTRQHWYSLQPDAPVSPDDWLHWTRGAMNWNGMCAECHSTHLQKSYDPVTDTYRTTWSELDVSCEACHGPCSKHLEWARAPAAAGSDSTLGLVIPARTMTARAQVELCAQCHARRSLLGPYEPARGSDLLDHMVPVLLDEQLYFPDGQVQGEVYEYGSFVQSKMFAKGVRCTDCHDPHSGQRRAEGNALCLRCHKAETFDASTHHFHQREVDGQLSPGALCTSCHMPRRVYMGIDARADHSLRIPRPDLTLELGMPNACAQAGCHADKSARWAAAAFAKWYGAARPPHVGQLLAAARAGKSQALAGLTRLIEDRQVPTIVRATAVSLLGRYPGATAQNAVVRALDDEESLVRRAALEQSPLLPQQEFARRVPALLRDPVQAVREEAARALAESPGLRVAAADTTAFHAALAACEASMRTHADFATNVYNLGNLHTALGRFAEAEHDYQAAVRIDPLLVQGRVNYAMLLSSLGRNADAEAQLRAALRTSPDLAEGWYNLGLLLAELQRLPEGVEALERATALAPDFAPAFYNLGVAYRELGRPDAASRALRHALRLQPDDTRAQQVLDAIAAEGR